MYHRGVIPSRDRLLQLARLVGPDAFAERFGPPLLLETIPDVEALRALVRERIDHVARGLVEEAAASDDVIDTASAIAYLDDRLRTLDDLLSPQQADRIRSAFREGTAGW